MDDLSFAIAVVVWALLPGLALLYAVDIEWRPVERTAGAVGLSLALGAAAAYIAEVIGWPITPVPVLAIVAVVCALAAAGSRFFGDRRLLSAAPAGAAFEEPAPAWIPWLVWLLPLAVVTQLEPIWKVALLPPSLHDGLDHANWFRLLYEIHSLDPHVIAAPPLAPDGSPSYYPWGFHAWMALVAQTTTLDPVAVLMRACVLISAAVPLAVYVFAAWFVGRGWPAVAAAGFSLLFWWLPYQVWGWGGYPLLAGAVAALPLSRLAVSVVMARSPVGIVAAGICALGVLAIHPSQAFVALLITGVVSSTWAAARLLPWWTPVPFLLTLAITGLALGFAASVWPPLESFLERARGVGATLAGDSRYRWPMGLYFDNGLDFPAVRQLGLGMLCIVGGLYALVNRGLRPVLALHVAFSLLIPLSASMTWLTSLWYHAPERIWYAQYASLPILAALGVSGAFAILRGAARWPAPRWVRHPFPDLRHRFPDLRRRGGASLAWLLALSVVFAIVYRPYVSWGSFRMFLFAQRNQQLTVTDRRILADFEWMRQNVPAGEVLFNAPADWGLPLPFTGHRTVFWSGGAAFDRAVDWRAIVGMLQRGGPHAAHAAEDLSRMGIRYIYAGVLNPRLTRNGRMRLEGQALEGTPGFELLYRSSTARVFRMTDDRRGELLELVDSDRVQFEGFHELERLGEVTWRWTDGKARVRIRTMDSEAGECFVRIFGPDPDTYELRVDGDTLPFTAQGHRIPASASAAEVIEIEVLSETVVPVAVGTGHDERLLGVRVRNIALTCGAS